MPTLQVQNRSEARQISPKTSADFMAPEREPKTGPEFEPARINRRAFAYYDRLGRIESHLRANISAPLSLSQAADLAGLEKSYFSAYFHKNCGVRFCEWMAYERVQKAKFLLQITNRAIEEICLDVGYRDLRTFQRNFKRYAGTSPGAFKKSIIPH